MTLGEVYQKATSDLHQLPTATEIHHELEDIKQFVPDNDCMLEDLDEYIANHIETPFVRYFMCFPSLGLMSPSSSWNPHEEPLHPKDDNFLSPLPDRLFLENIMEYSFHLVSRHVAKGLKRCLESKSVEVDPGSVLTSFPFQSVFDVSEEQATSFIPLWNFSDFDTSPMWDPRTLQLNEQKDASVWEFEKGVLERTLAGAEESIQVAFRACANVMADGRIKHHLNERLPSGQCRTAYDDLFALKRFYSEVQPLLTCSKTAFPAPITSDELNELSSDLLGLLMDIPSEEGCRTFQSPLFVEAMSNLMNLCRRRFELDMLPIVNPGDDSDRAQIHGHMYTFVMEKVRNISRPWGDQLLQVFKSRLQHYEAMARRLVAFMERTAERQRRFMEFLDEKAHATHEFEDSVMMVIRDFAVHPLQLVGLGELLRYIQAARVLKREHWEHVGIFMHCQTLPEFDQAVEAAPKNNQWDIHMLVNALLEVLFEATITPCVENQLGHV